MKITLRAALAVLVALFMTVALLGAPQAASAKDTSWGARAVAGSVAAKDTSWGARKAWGTAVTHAADDSGFTGPIVVVCNNGTRLSLARGETTFLGSGGGCSLSGVDRIIVAQNQTVYCKNYAPPYENTYFYTGTNYVPSNRTYKCYSQRPL